MSVNISLSSQGSFIFRRKNFGTTIANSKRQQNAFSLSGHKNSAVRFLKENRIMAALHRDGFCNPALWGLVLAAGDGKRLKSFIRKVRGEDLPKQYVNFVGRRSMIEHTFDRAERLVSPDQILTVISKQHLLYGAVRQQLACRRPQNVIVQPENKETAPGILLPLMHIYKRSPEAIVAVFPSDHFILEEDRFMDHVELAFQAVAHDPSRLILLAMEAQHPDLEYGYILPRAEEGSVSVWGIHDTAGFVEKPTLATARSLIRSGALWNTMIMVFKARVLLEALQELCPTMYTRFAGIRDAIGSDYETMITDETYRNLQPVNFSTAFLEKIAVTNPRMLSVLPVLQVTWSDWGSPERLIRDCDSLCRSRGRIHRTERPAAGSQAPQINDHHSVPWHGDTRSKRRRKGA